MKKQVHQLSPWQSFEVSPSFQSAGITDLQKWQMSICSQCQLPLSCCWNINEVIPYQSVNFCPGRQEECQGENSHLPSLRLTCHTDGGDPEKLPHFHRSRKAQKAPQHTGLLEHRVDYQHRLWNSSFFECSRKSWQWGGRSDFIS